MKNSNAMATQADGRDLVNQLLGQAQAFQAAGNMLRTFGISKLALVKESKGYRALKGALAPNGSELVGTWEEFCGLLGMSVDKADEDIKNLQAFGEAALEQMQSVGIGYRDLKQFRKLPQDAQLALVEAAKAGDKETLLDLAEDLIARQQQEKAKLQDDADEWKSKANTAAVDRQKAEAEAEGLRKQLQKSTTQGRTDAVPIVVADLRAEMGALVKKAELSIDGLLPITQELQGLRGTAVDEWSEATAQLAQAGLVALRMQVDAAMERLADAFDLPQIADDMQPNALAGLSPQETEEFAKQWEVLTRAHQHEAALRKHERDEAKPKGRGRPKAAPVAE